MPVALLFVNFCFVSLMLEWNMKKKININNIEWNMNNIIHKQIAIFPLIVHGLALKPTGENGSMAITFETSEFRTQKNR